MSTRTICQARPTARDEQAGAQVLLRVVLERRAEYGSARMLNGRRPREAEALM